MKGIFPLKFSIIAVIFIVAVNLIIEFPPRKYWKRQYAIKQSEFPDKFIAFLPYGRLSNRYFEIKIMIHLAYYLNRTLVLIPYQGSEIDELFDLADAMDKFNRIHLVITWKKYQQMHNMIPCVCLPSTYYALPDDRFPVCNRVPHNITCKGFSLSPILGKERLYLLDIEAALAIRDTFILVSGQWVWGYRFIKGFPEILARHKNQTLDFHLNYSRNIWNEAHRMYAWFMSKSNSSNKSTLSIHIRQGDLSGRINLTMLLSKAKEFSRKHFVRESLVFIATDANSIQREIIRQEFPFAQIECPREILNSCEHPVHKLCIIQAFSSLTTYFFASPGSTFTGVINLMRSFSQNKLS